MSNYLLQKQAERDQITYRTAEHLTEQFMMDTLQITLHRQKDAWGFDRLIKLMKDWTAVQEEFAPALNPTTDAEADYMQECMDRELAQIIKNRMKLIPFKNRYPALKGILYKRGNKKWTGG